MIECDPTNFQRPDFRRIPHAFPRWCARDARPNAIVSHEWFDELELQGTVSIRQISPLNQYSLDSKSTFDTQAIWSCIDSPNRLYYTVYVST